MRYKFQVVILIYFTGLPLNTSVGIISLPDADQFNFDSSLKIPISYVLKLNFLDTGDWEQPSFTTSEKKFCKQAILIAD